MGIEPLRDLAPPFLDLGLHASLALPYTFPLPHIEVGSGTVSSEPSPLTVWGQGTCRPWPFPLKTTKAAWEGMKLLQGCLSGRVCFSKPIFGEGPRMPK